jgi:hypothetical protein
MMNLKVSGRKNHRLIEIITWHLPGGSEKYENLLNPTEYNRPAAYV